MVRDISSGGFGTACIVKYKLDNKFYVAKFGLNKQGDQYASVESDALWILRNDNLIKIKSAYFNDFKKEMI